METKLSLVKYAHTVGESNLHLQFTPKYRKKIFRDKDVLADCEREFKEKADELKVQLAGLGFGQDHVHLFVCGWKNYSIANWHNYSKAQVQTTSEKNILCDLQSKAFMATKCGAADTSTEQSAQSQQKQ